MVKFHQLKMSINENKRNVSALTPLLRQRSKSTQKVIINSKKNSDSNIIETEKNDLGTIQGVFIPCLLTILGIVLFERLSWYVSIDMYYKWYLFI